MTTSWSIALPLAGFGMMISLSLPIILGRSFLIVTPTASRGRPLRKRRAKLRFDGLNAEGLNRTTKVLDFARRVCEIEHMEIPLTTALIVDDDSAIALSAELLLGDMFAQTVSASNPAAAIEAMHGSRPGVVFLDLNYTRGATDGGEGLTLLAEILTIDPDCVVIVITAHADIAVAVEAIKRGATDFVQKPWDNERLVATAQAATKLRYARDAALGHRQRIAEAGRVAPGSLPLLGSSRGMRNVFDDIARAAPSDANILVLGENGTGKELVARAIHQQSLRAEALLVTVDVGALGQSLIESELFGHVKGAFTDAKLDRIGRFQAANGGTLFLDEIGNLPLHMQPKLLTVLEQRRVTPVGSNRPVAVDVRIVSATNLSRADLIDDRVMRQDLLFRLNTIEIVIPPLRERSEDIPQLLDHFLSFYARKYNKASRKMPWEIVEMLTNYAWPGNVRELRHLVERAVIMANPHEFRSDDFPIAREGSARAPDITGDENDLNLDRTERRLIREALQRNNENISRSALDLGITRHALARKIDKHGL